MILLNSVFFPSICFAAIGLLIKTSLRTLLRRMPDNARELEKLKETEAIFKMVQTKYWVMETKFEGIPKQSDLAVKEEELPSLNDGEALTEAVWWSVDPFNRAYMKSAPSGTPMIGFQVGKVVESNNSKYPVGAHVVSTKGWRTMSIISGKDPLAPAYPVPDLGPLPMSLAVGVLGMPGMTAYFGLLELNQPKEGETVVVNAAAGAVGSAVGQIAKIKGCRVVGFAGTEEKVAWLKEVGFDAAYNYKKVDLPTVLKESCPNGVDCFFDNVGGSFADAVYPFLNTDARIAQCGAISQYNATEEQKIVDFRASFISRRISLLGLYVTKWLDRWPEGITQMAKWIAEGKIKYQETHYKGFEKLPQAMIDQLNGVNNGKSVIEA